MLCVQCQTPIVPHRGRPSDGCSPACRRTIWKARQAANKAAYKKTKRILRQCHWCLQLFEVDNYKKQLFCGRLCAHKHRRWCTLKVPIAIKEKILALSKEYA